MRVRKVYLRLRNRTKTKHRKNCVLALRKLVKWLRVSNSQQIKVNKVRNSVNWPFRILWKPWFLLENHFLNFFGTISEFALKNSLSLPFRASTLLQQARSRGGILAGYQNSVLSKLSIDYKNRQSSPWTIAALSELPYTEEDNFT